MAVDLLRFITAGSVDDGKSTLIGRLLVDSKSILEDQYKAIKTLSDKRGSDCIDLSLFTDGLKDERAQGITIDVAYRYFSTTKRKFIIADTPGHIQYTRNMVTGASTADLGLILIDARKGVVEQTRRHSLIASLLQLPHLIICVNKMDLVDYSEEVFNQITDDFKDFAAKLAIPDIQFVPLSALKGDQVVSHSSNMPWFKGSTLLHILETIPIANAHNHIDTRLPIQTVIRSGEIDYRGYAGRLASGLLRPGDKVKILPSGKESEIKSIHTPDGKVDMAFTPQSVVVELDHALDISRGDMLIKANNTCKVGQEIDAMMCWLDEQPMNPAKKYILKHTTHETKSIIVQVTYRLNIETMSREESPATVGMNDIIRVKLKTTSPLFYDAYSSNRTTGSFILIEDGSFNTVAAGMIRN